MGHQLTCPSWTKKERRVVQLTGIWPAAYRSVHSLDRQGSTSSVAFETWLPLLRTVTGTSRYSGLRGIGLLCTLQRQPNLNLVD